MCTKDKRKSLEAGICRDEVIFGEVMKLCVEWSLDTGGGDGGGWIVEIWRQGELILVIRTEPLNEELEVDGMEEGGTEMTAGSREESCFKFESRDMIGW